MPGGSFLGAGVGDGSSLGASPAGTTFLAIILTPQLVSNALVSPWAAPNALAVPTTDDVIRVYDAAGNAAIWTYNVTTAATKGVQIS
jgi:hypothetical protein